MVKITTTRRASRTMALAAAVLGMSTALAACGGGSDSGDGEDSIKAGYISPVGSQPGQQQVSLGMEQGAEALGWSISVLDANLSSDKQVSMVDTLITQKVNVMGAWSLDANALAGAYTRAQAEGIPVVGVNSVGEGVTGTVWWESSTCTAGGPWDQEAAWIAERKPNANVYVMGGPPVEAIVKNVECFRAAAEAAGLNIVGQVDNSDDNTANANQLAGDVLTKNKDIDVFWAYNDTSALGISSAADAAGLSVYTDSSEEGMMIFGVNGDRDAIDAVRDGRITGTWDPNTLATGFAVIKMMDLALEDPKAKQPDIVVEAEFITQENADSWTEPEDRQYTVDDFPRVDG